MKHYPLSAHPVGLLVWTLLILVQSAQAQSPQALGNINCTYTSIFPSSRAESLTGVTGLLRLNCTNDGPDILGFPGPPGALSIQDYVLANIALNVNTNITNRIDFGSGADITDAVLVIEDNEPATPEVTSVLGAPDPRFPVPQLGQLVGPSNVVFNGVQFPVPGGPVDPDNIVACDFTPGAETCFPFTVNLEIKNVRVDNTSFGIPLDPPFPADDVIGFVTVFSFAGISVLPDNQTIMGRPSRGIISSSSLGVGPGDFDVEILEGVPRGFKPLGVANLDNPGWENEAGYGVPGSLDATQGARILVDFVDESPGGTITVPNELINGGFVLKHVVGADADGAGGVVTGGAGMSVIDTASGSGRIVYEVDQSVPTLPDTVILPASVIPAVLEDIRVSVMLGPTSTVDVADETAPLPRFASVFLPISVVADGTASAGAGDTLSDDDSDASVTFPAGEPGADTEVKIDQVDAPFSTPPPAGFTSVGTGFVNINLDPPLPPGTDFCPAGLTVVLPVNPPLPAGTVLPLLKVNPVTGVLEIVNDCGGIPLEGTVDPGGTTATFLGVPSLSLIVGLAEGPTGTSVLLVSVESLVGDGHLRKGLDAPLKAFLNKALEAIAEGDTELAIKFLEKFQGRVEYLVEKGALDPTIAQGLIDAAEDIIQAL